MGSKFTLTNGAGEIVGELDMDEEIARRNRYTCKNNLMAALAPLDIQDRVAAQMRKPDEPEGVSVLVRVPQGIVATAELIHNAGLELCARDYPGRILTGDVLLVDEIELGTLFEVVCEVKA